MQVLVAVPGKHHLNAISPLLAALGERVVPVATDARPPRQASRSSIVSTFQEALKEHAGPAVFPTTYMPPWAIFNVLLADAANCRALVFYEPAGLGIARNVEAGATVFSAAATWSEEARSLAEFVRTNSRQVTLVRLDEALQAPRALLGACAERFLFDTVDCTARPAQASFPATLYRLVADATVRQMPSLSALDAQLAKLALALEDGNSTYLGDVDRFIAGYRDMLLHQRNHTRALAEADALRTANRLAEDAAQALRLQLANNTDAPQTGLPYRGAGAAPDGDMHAHIAALEAEKERLRTALADVQEIAEAHVSETAALRVRSEEDHRELMELQAELRRNANTRAAAPDVPPGALDEAVAPVRKSTRAVATGIRPFQPRRWLQARREAALVVKSGFFDAAWYIERNTDIQALGVDPAKHFVRYGGQEGRAPGPDFSSRRYLDDNPDVASAGLNPLVHYLRLGKAEGRKIRRAE